jgi:hypothetical protein
MVRPEGGERCCYQMNLAPIAAQMPECAIETCYNWQLDPTSTLLGRSIWRPLRAHPSGWLFPGLKPWAESSCPFGAQISGNVQTPEQRAKGVGHGRLYSDTSHTNNSASGWPVLKPSAYFTMPLRASCKAACGLARPSVAISKAAFIEPQNLLISGILGMTSPFWQFS